MRRIQYNDIDVCLHKLFHALQAVCRDTDRCAAEKTSLRILRRVRILDLLFDILNSNEPF